MPRTAVKASYAGISFWAESVSGRAPRRVIEHQSFGRTGSDTEDTGAPSRRDTISARMDYDSYIDLYKAVHGGKPRLFTHPIFGSWQARASIDSDSVEARRPGVVTFSITFTEHKTAALATPKASKSPAAQQQELASIYSDADELVYDD
jgi:prophage DNA circulation protein